MQEPVDDDVALVVPTSGSTGEPKQVLLTADALRASAQATADRLGGTGRWLLAIPATHIGGLQVLVRSVLSGLDPVLLEQGRFTADRFAAAGPADYVSLVPTQLARLLADERDLLPGFAAVLLGGAAAPAGLLAQARARGVRVVTTYGMSETCGGCVYDGVPLDGVSATLVDGRIHLSGPVLARGYRHRPDLTAEVFRDGGFRTSDLGRLRSDGTLQVLGRADDVIVTGGEKVAPEAVAAVLAAQPAVRDAVVLGVADPEWGQRVVAVLVLHDGATFGLDDARSAVAASLPRTHAPRELLVVPVLPTLPSGKPDRLALRSAVETRAVVAGPRPQE